MNTVFNSLQTHITGEDCKKFSKSVSYETLVIGATTTGTGIKQTLCLYGCCANKPLTAVGTLTSLLCNSAKVMEKWLQNAIYFKVWFESKRISKFLAVSMLTTVLSLNLSTAWATVDGGTCGDGCNWSYNTETKELTLSGNGTMDDFGWTNSDFGHYVTPWWDYTKQIESVVVANESKLSNIGQGAFCKASNLKSVSLGNVEAIGYQGFSSTSSLINVDMPNVKTIGNTAFAGATQLTSISMPEVISIGEDAFFGETFLRYVELNNNWQIDEEGYFKDGDNRVELNPTPYNSQACYYMGGKWDSSVGSGKCYAGMADRVFFNTLIDDCGKISTDNFENCNVCRNINSYSYQIGTGQIFKPNSNGIAGSCVSTCGTGYLEKNGLCISADKGCGSGYLLENTTCVNKEVGCNSGFLNKDDVVCVEPSSCTGEYIVDSENGLCKKMPGCLNYADGACGGCERGFYKKEGGCVSSEEGCGSGYLEKDSVCISSANGCGAGYKDMGGFCNRIRYTPAEAAPLLHNDNTNEVTITFKK